MILREPEMMAYRSNFFLSYEARPTLSPVLNNFSHSSEAVAAVFDDTMPSEVIQSASCQDNRKITHTSNYAVPRKNQRKCIPEEQTGVQHEMIGQPLLLYHNTQFSSKSISAKEYAV